MRLEGLRYGDAPAWNVTVASAFGLNTGQYPSEAHLSPRIGFTYSSAGDNAGDAGLLLRGGIGEFRGRIPDAIFANAAQSTGLPSGQSRLTCTGAGVPVPDWRAYFADPANIPTSCAGAPSINSEQLPSVIVFGNHTSAPRTWRTSLGATHHLVGPFTAAVDLFYIAGVSQLGIPDLNLRPNSVFALSNEAGRPIYVPASTIDPATGTVSINASRLHPQFGQVSAHSTRSEFLSYSACRPASPSEVKRGRNDAEGASAPQHCGRSAFYSQRLAADPIIAGALIKEQY